MAYGELGMAELREILRRWMRGEGLRGPELERLRPHAAAVRQWLRASG